MTDGPQAAPWRTGTARAQQSPARHRNYLPTHCEGKKHRGRQGGRIGQLESCVPPGTFLNGQTAKIRCLSINLGLPWGKFHSSIALHVQPPDSNSINSLLGPVLHLLPLGFLKSLLLLHLREVLLEPDRSLRHRVIVVMARSRGLMNTGI